jgi:hypothetical protein
MTARGARPHAPVLRRRARARAHARLTDWRGAAALGFTCPPLLHTKAPGRHEGKGRRFAVRPGCGGSCRGRSQAPSLHGHTLCHDASTAPPTAMPPHAAAVLAFPCRPTAQSGAWEPQARTLSLRLLARMPRGVEAGRGRPRLLSSQGVRIFSARPGAPARAQGSAVGSDAFRRCTVLRAMLRRGPESLIAGGGLARGPAQGWGRGPRVTAARPRPQRARGLRALACARTGPQARGRGRLKPAPPPPQVQAGCAHWRWYMQRRQSKSQSRVAAGQRPPAARAHSAGAKGGAGGGGLDGVQLIYRPAGGPSAPAGPGPLPLAGRAHERAPRALGGLRRGAVTAGVESKRRPPGGGGRAAGPLPPFLRVHESPAGQGRAGEGRPAKKASTGGIRARRSSARGPPRHTGTAAARARPPPGPQLTEPRQWHPAASAGEARLSHGRGGGAGLRGEASRWGGPWSVNVGRGAATLSKRAPRLRPARVLAGGGPRLL